MTDFNPGFWCLFDSFESCMIVLIDFSFISQILILSLQAESRNVHWTQIEPFNQPDPERRRRSQTCLKTLISQLFSKKKRQWIIH